MKKDIITLQDQWDCVINSLDDYFIIWTKAYPCPKCKKQVLDFSAPHLGHSIICRNCYTLFDLTPVKISSDKSKSGSK